MPRIKLSQLIPRIVKIHVSCWPCQLGVIRVSNGVQILWSQPGVLEGPLRGQLRKLPRRERHRALAVLAPAEALLLGRRDDGTVDDKGSSRVMKQGVDAKNPHRAP